MHAAGRVGRGCPRDQPVVESLVIPFQMLMRDKLRDRASEVPLPQRNHSIETFFLDRPNESLGVRICVRGAIWCQDHADPGVAKPLSHAAAPFPVPIADQHTMSISTPS